MRKGTLLVCTLSLLLGSLVISCGNEQPTRTQEVTFKQLFVDPDSYNGRLISMEGFYFQGFEIQVITEKLEYSGYAEGHLVPKGRMIWIEGGIPEEVFDRLKQQQMLGPTERYGKVRITGQFDYGGKYGHLGGYDSQLVPSKVELLEWSQVVQQ